MNLRRPAPNPLFLAPWWAWGCASVFPRAGWGSLDFGSSHPMVGHSSQLPLRAQGLPTVARTSAGRKSLATRGQPPFWTWLYPQCQPGPYPAAPPLLPLDCWATLAIKNLDGLLRKVKNEAGSESCPRARAKCGSREKGWETPNAAKGPGRGARGATGCQGLKLTHLFV